MNRRSPKYTGRPCLMSQGIVHGSQHDNRVTNGLSVAATLKNLPFMQGTYTFFIIAKNK